MDNNFKKPFPHNVLRAALYIRVSTAEQATHGYSLEAQKELLEAHAKQHGMRIVGIYADEGKSASKKLHLRKELLRMVDDMEAGEIDVILFKDITRWSRNSAHYFKVQERIDAAGGYWVAVQQPYLETKTPTGRYQVTIMLGNAQLESEQNSERIKFTNESRLPKGGVLYGAQCCPVGYTIGTDEDGNKRMIIDEEKADIARAIFDHYEINQTITGTIRFLSEQFNYKMDDVTLRKALANSLYCGEYKGIENYCPAYITKERFEEIQRIRSIRASTAQPHNGTYIFSSLLRCVECGRNLSGCHSGSEASGKRYVYYRCKQYQHYRKCTHKGGTNEKKLEKWLLENIDDEMRKYVQAVKVEDAAPPSTEKKRAAIERKLKNARELYIDGDLTKEEYTRKKDGFEAQLAALPVYKKRNTRNVEKLLNSDWREMYDTLTAQERRVFWRSIISRIDIDVKQNYTVYFFD